MGGGGSVFPPKNLGGVKLSNSVRYVVSGSAWFPASIDKLNLKNGMVWFPVIVLQWKMIKHAESKEKTCRITTWNKT